GGATPKHSGTFGELIRRTPNYERFPSFRFTRRLRIASFTASPSSKLVSRELAPATSNGSADCSMLPAHRLELGLACGIAVLDPGATNRQRSDQMPAL